MLCLACYPSIHPSSPRPDITPAWKPSLTPPNPDIIPPRCSFWLRPTLATPPLEASRAPPTPSPLFLFCAGSATPSPPKAWLCSHLLWSCPPGAHSQLVCPSVSTRLGALCGQEPWPVSEATCILKYLGSNQLPSAPAGGNRDWID